ncbi:hypothetical protein [Achromobacter animicus]|uniref:hypothetical protein n=1 Tax=Achromobacter animicus TaxID=1389935 RepID=UPI00244A9698|nr:hypothetical protein [Achromobacter animicus]MDH0683016.1 hypothetical protein [Achromobacter animicus]
MPRKPKTPLAELPSIPAELLKSFGDGPMTAEAISERPGYAGRYEAQPFLRA